MAHPTSTVATVVQAPRANAPTLTYRETPTAIPGQIPAFTPTPSAASATTLASETATPHPTLFDDVLTQGIRPTLIPPTPPPPTLAEICSGISSHEPRGLYLLAINPFPELRWDWNPREFHVAICNHSPDPTHSDIRFVVYISYPNENHPLGQTAELPIRLAPGLSEITLRGWKPGLQNHVTACATHPAVELSVDFRIPQELPAFHPIRFPDGKEAVTIPVPCGGTFS